MKFVTHVLYAQATSYVTNALKIKEAFPTLPNKKVLKMHNAAFAQSVNKTKKVQYTTKEPSRKQAIIPVPNDLAENIMGDASTYIFQINALLKNVKSLIYSEFICSCSGRIAIITNNVPSPSDLSVIEKYFKSVKGINSNNIPSPQLCHKLHSAISLSILHQFSWSQWLQKALEKTFQSIPVMPRSNQYWPRY